MRALLIVDLQNDFLPGGALAVPHGDEVIAYINQIMGNYELIFATKDSHPPNHVSFAEHHGKAVGEVVLVAGKEQQLWPVHCVEGSEGADFPAALNQEKIDQVFFKGRDPAIDSYSAFFDHAHARSTGLDQELKKRGVEELDVVGLATEYCVKYSVLDALELGYRVNVLSKGCRGIELQKGDSLRALQEMERAGAVIPFAKNKETN